ncbi:hypothetical protein CKO15_08560 [Halorhodospira abdelmalekii]|nr:hypothetical protein [Halorhodospira abdelmalekii]
MQRSNEPPLWLLFSAGGTLAALIAPALILYTGWVVPLAERRGVELLDYESLHALLQSGVGAAAIVVLITLLLLHSAHRGYHLLHDLGIDAGPRARRGCYAAAAAGGIAATLAVVVL